MRRLSLPGMLLTFVLASLTVGPAPGEVGGCGESVQQADAEQFCVESSAWNCRRRQYAGELDEEGVQGCFDAVLAACEGAQWPGDCTPPPTVREANACVDQLKKIDNVGVSQGDIAECRLCSGRGSEGLGEAP